MSTSLAATCVSREECMRADVAEKQMRQWRDDPSWQEVKPSVKVSNPKGTFCQLDCSVLVALPPADVFALLCDTGNKRVFKNVKGVRNREVIEDDGRVAVIELELVTGWRFLVFSGEFSVHMRLTQDRPNMKLSFELAKSGFMKTFKGAWSVEPVEVPATPSTDSSAEHRVDEPRVASRVGLIQSVQPAVNPPPILAHYLRHIAAKALHESLRDIQIEAARLRYSLPEDASVESELRKRGISLVARDGPEPAAIGA